MVLPKKERETLLEEALAGYHNPKQSFSEKASRALKALKVTRTLGLKYGIKNVVQAYKFRNPKNKLSFEDRIGTLYLVLPETSRLKPRQKEQLISLIGEHTEIFFKTISGENLERVANLLGKHLELFAQKVDMNTFGQHAGKKLYNFAQGAKENLEYFARGLAYEKEGTNSLAEFGMGAYKHLIKLREGAGYDNYQKFLDGLPKRHRYVFDRVEQ